MGRDGRKRERKGEMQSERQRERERERDRERNPLVLFTAESFMTVNLLSVRLLSAHHLKTPRLCVSAA